MEEVDYSKYEIVGFNGALLLPTVQCARALPVGRIKGREDYFRADNNFHQNGAEHHSVARYSLEEIKGFESEKRLTLLVSPFPMVKDAMVLYATEERLNSKGLNPLIKPIAVLDGQSLIWQNLPEKGVWATYSESKTIERLLHKLKSQ